MPVISSYSNGVIMFNHTLDEHPNPLNYKMHTHSTFEVCVFISGDGCFHIEGITYPLKDGDILIMKPMESHYIEIKSDIPYEYMTVKIEPSISSLYGIGEQLFKPFYERNAGEYNLYRRNNFKTDLYLNIVDSLKSETDITDYSILGNSLVLLNEISKADNRHFTSYNLDSDISEIIRFINENLAESLRISDICSRFFISKSVLCKKFKAATGSTVSEYISTKRVMHALELIKCGMSKTDAAQICGYYDYSTFYRACKKLST